MNRRELLTTLLATAAVNGNIEEIKAQETATRELKPLPFAANSLDGISEKVIMSHHQNNYAGAFRRVEAIRSEIANLRSGAPGFLRKGLMMEELTATNAVILHEEYFATLAEVVLHRERSSKPLQTISEALIRGNRSFG